MSPHHCLRCTCVYTSQQGGLITVHKRWFFLKEWLSVVYSVKLFTGFGLQFVLRHPGEVDLTVVFFIKYMLKSWTFFTASL